MSEQKTDDTRDAILDAIVGHLTKFEGRHTPRDLRDMAEAHALLTGKVTSVAHSHTTVQSR